jgi:hypothetical protein
MKATLTQWIQDLTFNYMIYNLGIEPAPKETQADRFDEWMKAMGNIHYHDNEAMVKAYEKVNNN